MGRFLSPVILLIFSNTFMTLAWYGHLKMSKTPLLQNKGLFIIILLSWGVAFFEYLFQVPANKIGFNENGGPYSLWQLKVIQEVITLAVFTVFTLVFFKEQALKWNHLVGFAFLVLAVYFCFKK